MCFNRRRNIFTLGDIQNTTNPVISRVRAQLNKRHQIDVFERDPFKVQSYNFRYAERPSILETTNQNRIFPFLSKSRTLDTKPFETYFYNHGFNFTRHDQNNSQTGESTSLRRHKAEHAQVAKGITANLSSKSAFRFNHDTTTTSSQQTVTQRQQLSFKYPTYTPNQSHSTNEQKLSEYLERRQAARNNKSANTSTTSVSAAAAAAEAQSDQLPSWLCRNEERISQTPAARAKQAARGTSKAMAAAVGTVGRVSNTACCSNSTNEASSDQFFITKANTRKQLSAGTIGGSFAPPISTRCNISSWRSCPAAESPRNTRVSCSTSVLGRKTNVNGVQQDNKQLRQPHAQRTSGLHQWRLVPPHVETVVNRNGNKTTSASRTLVQRCHSCEISINITGPQSKQAKPENVVIKIESASPFKVVSNSNCSTSSAVNMRRKRLNNLMSCNTTTKVSPRNLNITPKASSGTLQLNKWQSKHSLNSSDSCSINQRLISCENFIKREGEHLRQKAGLSTTFARKSSDVGHVLGMKSSRNLFAERVPCMKSSTAVQPNTAVRTSNSSRITTKVKTAASVASPYSGSLDGAATSQRLKNTCNRNNLSLQQLRDSIDAISMASNGRRSVHSAPAALHTLKRSSTAPKRLNSLSASDRLTRQASTSTFTLPRRSTFDTKTARSISPSTMRNSSSFFY